jgi:hypothetical protein
MHWRKQILLDVRQDGIGANLALDIGRAGVWGSCSSMGLPNVIEPCHEFIGVNLGLTFCREGMQRLVSQFQVLEYPPSIAPRTVGILCNIDPEYGGFRHYRIMR